MATTLELLEAIDAFVAVEKRIVGTDGPCEWGPGYNKHEMKARFPIEVDGELPSPARLEIIGFPNVEPIQFRIILCYSAAVCRLDFTNEYHPNSYSLPEDGVPPEVIGPHYHAWKINRRFFRGLSRAPELRNAVPFSSRGSFDSNLRWFCQEVNIQQPDGRHVIELPSRTELF